jgi:NarL family two-component system response regulator LiaR
MSAIRIALVDDHRVVARSVQAYLESFADLTVVGIAASGEELLEHVDAWRPDVVLQDLLLPGGLDGIATTRRVRQHMRQVQVVALTASVDEARMTGVLRAGAAGYVRKDATPEVLLAAIRAVAAGGTYVDRSIAAQLRPDAAPVELTTRERQVLTQIASARSNKAISQALHISEETVKTHVAHVLAKLDAENRAQAVVQALRRGLVSLEDFDGRTADTPRSKR